MLGTVVPITSSKLLDTRSCDATSSAPINRTVVGKASIGVSRLEAWTVIISLSASASFALFCATAVIGNKLSAAAGMRKRDFMVEPLIKNVYKS